MEIEDVVVGRLARCQERLESEGASASRWRVEWDGGPMLITALRGAETVREFKATPEVLYERDDYTKDWEAVVE